MLHCRNGKSKLLVWTQQGRGTITKISPYMLIETEWGLNRHWQISTSKTPKTRGEKD